MASLNPISQTKVYYSVAPVKETKSDSNILLSIITAFLRTIASLFSPIFGKSKSSDLAEKQVNNETGRAPTSRERAIFQGTTVTPATQSAPVIPASKDPIITTLDPTVGVVEEANKIKKTIKTKYLPYFEAKLNMSAEKLKSYFGWVKEMITWNENLNEKKTEVAKIIGRPLKQLNKELTRFQLPSRLKAIDNKLKSYLLLTKFTPEERTEISEYIDQVESDIDKLNLHEDILDASILILILRHRLNDPNH